MHDTSLHSHSGHHSGPVGAGADTTSCVNMNSSGHLIEGKSTLSDGKMEKKSSSNDILISSAHSGTDPRLKAVLRDMVQALEFALWNTVMGK